MQFIGEDLKEGVMIASHLVLAQPKSLRNTFFSHRSKTVRVRTMW